MWTVQKVRCKAETFLLRKGDDAMSKKQYKKTITRTLRDDAYEFFKENYENNVTCSAYIRNYNRFITFCRERYNAKNKEDCKVHIEQYIKYLVEEKSLSPSTVHTYVAPVVLYHGESLNDYELPKRIVAHNTRSRNGRKTYCKNADPDNPEFARLVAFQRAVGLRRDELARLRKNDFVFDESDYPCIRIKQGKGGKRFLARILPENFEFVKSYFDGTDDFVFSREEMNNKIDLHKIRALHAQDMYKYYLHRLETEPGYRDILTKEIYARWNRDCKTKDGKRKKLPADEIQGYYFLRGENRKLAKRKGLPVKYDKTALLAVSIFSLAHFRNDVTIANYILNV